MSEFEDWAREEVEQWPGVTVRFSKRAKHRQAILCFNGQERFAVYPDTPGDNVRAVRNHVTDIRKTLLEMGAVRQPRKKAIGPKRQRNPGAAQRTNGNGERAPVRPDPWAALSAFKVAPKPKPTGMIRHLLNKPKPSFWDMLVLGIVVAGVMAAAVFVLQLAGVRL